MPIFRLNIMSGPKWLRTTFVRNASHTVVRSSNNYTCIANNNNLNKDFNPPPRKRARLSTNEIIINDSETESIFGSNNNGDQMKDEKNDCIHSKWCVTAEQERNPSCPPIDFTTKEMTDRICKLWEKTDGISDILDAYEKNDGELRLQTQACQITHDLFKEDFYSRSKLEQQYTLITYKKTYLTDSRLFNTASESQHQFLINESVKNHEENQNILGSPNSHETISNVESKELMDSMLGGFESIIKVDETDNIDNKLSNKRKKLPVSCDHPWYPFGSVFWVHFGYFLSKKQSPMKITNWIISSFNDKEININTERAVAIKDWSPMDAPHLLWLYLYHNTYKHVKKIQCQYIAQMYKEQGPVAPQYTESTAYDPIYQDYQCMIQTPIHRKLMNQPISKWTDKLKRNPIHEGNPKGKAHIGETKMGKYMFWRFNEKYTFLLRPNDLDDDETKIDNIDYDVVLKNLLNNQPMDEDFMHADLSDESTNSKYLNLMQPVQVVFPGTFLFSFMHDEYMLTINIINFKWDFDITMKDMSIDEWKNKIEALIKELEADAKNDKCHPTSEITIIPLLLKYPCKEHDHTTTENERELFINADSNHGSIPFKTIPVRDDWMIGNLIINNCIEFRDPNIDEDEKVQWWHLNWVVHNGQATKCLEFDEDMFIQCVEPLKPIRPGLSNNPKNNIVHAVYANHDGFTFARNSNGQLGWSNVLAFYTSPAHHFGSNKIIYSYGFTHENSCNGAFVFQTEMDFLWSVYRGHKIQYIDDDGETLVYAKLRTVLIGFWNDGKEVTRGIGSRGARSNRPSPFTSETKTAEKDLKCDKPLLHYSSLVTQQVCLSI